MAMCSDSTPTFTTLAAVPVFPQREHTSAIANATDFTSTSPWRGLGRILLACTGT
jgi:hypothetical protein